jgi:phospholipase C
LPYAFAVNARVTSARQVELSFLNQGTAGGAFIVHSKVRSDGPWYYTVEAGKRIEREAWYWSTSNYHLAATGPSGFLREFGGSLAAATAAGGARPEAWLNADPLAGAVDVVLSNAEGARSATFRLSDNSYGRSTTSHTVAAGQQVTVRVPVTASYGWYDLSVTCDFDSQYLRRMAGRVENGQASRTDPVLGRAAGGTQATLSASAASVARGTPIGFNCTVPSPQVNSKNWNLPQRQHARCDSIGGLAIRRQCGGQRKLCDDRHDGRQLCRLAAVQRWLYRFGRTGHLRSDLKT